MFPWSASGRVRIDATDADSYLRTLANQLAPLKPTGLEIRDGALRFRGGSFRGVDGWNLLVPFSSGTLRANREGGRLVVCYHVTFGEILAIGTLVAARFAAIPPPDGPQ